ncbi:MAG: hypothetical protein JXJ18_10900 [Rhodobacteraceae bacterium]|nr:hypothetical protein [Paracoccaceae bacterium]
MRAVILSLTLLGPLPAAALELDCVADLACVTTMGDCQTTTVPFDLRVGDKVGDKVILTDEDGQSLYEFRRLADSDGTVLQASGGAMEAGQGAGAMSIFDDLRFVLTRHARLDLDAATGQSEVVAITIQGSCTEPQE